MINFLFEKTPLVFLTQSLWRDEAFSVLLAKKSLFQLLYLTAADFNPPLYYLLLKFWIFIFGSSEIIVRSLSLIFYSLSIYLFVHILESLKIKGKALPTIAFSTLPIVFYYAFEARMYSMLLFLTLLFYFSFIEKKEKLLKFSLVLGLLTHYFFLFNLLIAFLVSSKRQKKELLLGFAFTLPWFIFAGVVKILNFEPGFWLERLNIKDLFLSPFYLFAAYDKAWEPLHKNAFVFAIFFWIIILLVFKTKKVKEKKLLSLWFGIPFFTSLLLSASFLPIFLPRYLIFIAPAPLLLLSQKQKYLIVKIILILVILFNLTYLNFLVKNKRKENLKSSLPLLKKLLDKNTLVYITKPEEYPTYVYYLGEDKIFIYGKTYDQIPPYIGKLIIPKEKLTLSPPFYPKKALIIKKDKKFTAISLK